MRGGGGASPRALFTPRGVASAYPAAEPLAFECAPLHLFELSDEEQAAPVYEALRGLPAAVKHYLERTVFPSTMSFATAKLSASGQELGGSGIFSQRVM